MQTESKVPIKWIIIITLIILPFVQPLGYFFEHYFPKKHNLEYIHYFDIIAEAVKTSLEIAILVLSIIHRKSIKRYFLNFMKHFSTRFESTGDDFPFLDGKVEAIIIPVSRREQPEWIIKFVKPKYISFVYTNHPDSKKATKELIREYKNKIEFNLTEQDIEEKEKYMITKPDNPNTTKLTVKHFIKEYLNKGIEKHKIFVDTTGGKVTMSIGAFQAAEEMGVSSIYIVGKGDKGLIDPEIRDSGNPIYLSEKK